MDGNGMPEQQQSLVEALERQKQEQEHQLRRLVRGFANRLRLLGFGSMVVGMLVTLAIQAWGRSSEQYWVGYLIIVILALTWGYSAAVLSVFWYRTRMTGYVLNAHWTWLAVLVGVPIDLAQVIWLGVRFPATLALVLAGSLFWRRRTSLADAEIVRRSALWERLLRLSWNDLFLMRFPSAPQPPEEDS